MNVNPYHADRIGENLLDNSYFLNTINQRGQESYQYDGYIDVYTIDRWLATYINVTVSKDGLSLVSGETPSYNFYQKLETSRVPLGQTVTLSALISECTGDVRLLIHELNAANIVATVCNTGLITVTTKLHDAMDELRVGLFMEKDATAKVLAMKLETGDKQTLARQEGGKWVLNEVPDYGEELRKCQRYQIVFPHNQFSNIQPIGTVIGLNGSGLSRINIPILTPLVKLPTISIVGQLRMEYVNPGDSSFVTQRIEKFERLEIEPGIATMSLVVTLPALKAGAIGRIDTGFGGKMIVDANL